MSDLSFLGVADLPAAWREGKIGQVTTKVGSGATPRGGAAVYVSDGVAFIRSQNVHDHQFAPRGLVHLPPEAAHALRGVSVQPGDVLLNITGDSILRTCVVPESVLPARVSQHVAIIRPDAQVDPAFLQKWLSLPAMKTYMLGHSSGGTRKAVTKGHILSFPIPLPPIEEQRGIAATLGALDDKIDSNRRTGELALALASGKYEAACHESSQIAAVDHVATFHNRRRIPLSQNERDMRPGPFPYYGASGVFGYVNDFLFDEVLALVGEDGSVVNDDGTPVTQYIWGKSWINNHAHALSGTGISTELLFLALRIADVRPIVTGAVQPKINMGNLRGLQLAVPSDSALARLETEIAPMFAVYRHRLDEVRRLQELRDALLPELMTGRMRVDESKVEVVL